MKTVLLALAALTFSSVSFAQDFECSGTEPFWDLQASANRLTYREPGEKALRLKVLSKQTATSASASTAFVFTAQDARLTVVAGTCDDGMSEREFSHHAVLEMNGIVLSGCCQAVE